MKKFKALLFIFIFFSAFLPARELDFSVSPYTALSFGTHYEHLYSGLSKGKEVSRLEWKMNPLLTLGAEASVKLRPLLFTLGAEFALPLECGQMLDSDYSYSIKPDEKIKYCYSINELKAEKNFRTHFDASLIWNISDTLFIMPTASVYYFYDSFEARKGYGWYGQETNDHSLVAWDDPRAKYYAKGQLNGVNFYRHSLFTFLGSKYTLTLGRFEFNLECLFSPYTYFYTMDTHLSKKRDYHLKQIQKSYFTHYLLGGGLQYKINNRLKVYSSLSYLTGNTASGKLYHDYTQKEILLSDQNSGASLDYTCVKMGLVVACW